MFTGIIESTGHIDTVQRAGSGRIFVISSPISSELKPDQSVSHDGVCLTVEQVSGNSHRVTAIRETLEKTNLGTWEMGNVVNLERCLRLNDRLDGHLVQGHVDGTGECIGKKDEAGSWLFRFRFDRQFAPLIVEKGSICVNGISLTAFDITLNEFSVAIIPFTYQHTNIGKVELGTQVNLEFDLLGKYILRQQDIGNRQSAVGNRQ